MSPLASRESSTTARAGGSSGSSSRRRGPRPDSATAAFLALGIEFVPVDIDLVLEAARVKATRAMSYADCFAVATAQRLHAPVVTGDPEFEHAEDLVAVEWIV